VKLAWKVEQAGVGFIRKTEARQRTMRLKQNAQMHAHTNQSMRAHNE
jgi:hypothetical protein